MPSHFSVCSYIIGQTIGYKNIYHDGNQPECSHMETNFNLRNYCANKGADLEYEASGFFDKAFNLFL